MRIIIEIYLFSTLLVLATACGKDTNTYDVREYGASMVEANNSEYIQKAIDQCYQNGGGRVIIPPGTYRSGPLEMKSKVEFHLSHGARLLATDNIADFEKNKALVWADKASKISITGTGTLDAGGGSEVWHKPENNYKRIKVIRFHYCQDVVVQDVSLVNAAQFVHIYSYCNGLTIDGVRINSKVNHNNDGTDILGCDNVVVKNCLIDSQDDGLCLKADAYSKYRETPCQNVTISNCVISSDCNPIKFGTTSAWGFKNICIHNCVIKPSDNYRIFSGRHGGLGGISLEMVDGGVLQDVVVDNIVMEGVATPIFIRLGNRGYISSDTTTQIPGTLKNVKVSNISASNQGRLSCSVTGIPGHYAENISLSNIRIISRGGGTQADVRRPVPDSSIAGIYPETSKFGFSLPAHGFYFRHVKNISLSNMQLYTKESDARPALVFDDVKGFSVNHISGQASSTGEAFVRVLRSQGGLLSQLYPNAPARLMEAGYGSYTIQLQ